MKYSFIVTVLCGLLVIGGACAHENDPEDGKRTNQTPLIVKATASNFNHLSISGSPFARTPLEDGAETQFSAGDAIGIFAVKNKVLRNKLTPLQIVITNGYTCSIFQVAKITRKTEITKKGVWLCSLFFKTIFRLIIDEVCIISTRYSVSFS